MAFYVKCLREIEESKQEKYLKNYIFPFYEDLKNKYDNYLYSIRKELENIQNSNFLDEDIKTFLSKVHILPEKVLETKELLESCRNPDISIQKVADKIFRINQSNEIKFILNKRNFNNQQMTLKEIMKKNKKFSLEDELTKYKITDFSENHIYKDYILLDKIYDLLKDNISENTNYILNFINGSIYSQKENEYIKKNITKVIQILKSNIEFSKNLEEIEDTLYDCIFKTKINLTICTLKEKILDIAKNDPEINSIVEKNKIFEEKTYNDIVKKYISIFRELREATRSSIFIKEKNKRLFGREFLEELKLFSFFNLKRVQLYYRLEIMELITSLFSQDEKFKIFLENNGIKISESQYSDIRRGKFLGSDWIKKIVDFFKEENLLDKALYLEKLYFYLNLYRNLDLENIISIKEYENMFSLHNELPSFVNVSEQDISNEYYIEINDKKINYFELTRGTKYLIKDKNNKNYRFLTFYKFDELPDRAVFLTKSKEEYEINLEAYKDFKKGLGEYNSISPDVLKENPLNIFPAKKVISKIEYRNYVELNKKLII